MKLKSKSLIGKLIRLFLYILFPIIIIGLFSLIFSNKRLENEILQSTLASTIQFANRFENEVSQTYELAAPLLEQVRVLRLSNPRYEMSAYEYITNTNIVRDLLTNIKISNSNISNVRIYFRRKGRIVNADHFGGGSIQTLTPERYNSLLKLHNNPDKMFSYNGRLIMLISAYMENPTILVEIEFDIAKMKRQFTSNLLYSDSDYLLLLNDGDCLVTSNANSDMIKLAQDTREEISPISKIAYEGKHYYVFWAELPYINGSWCQIIPMKMLTQPMLNSQIFTVIFTCIVLMGIYIFLTGAYKIIHRPMKSLLEAFESIQHGNFEVRIYDVDTSEFEYLYSNFNEMARDLDNMIQQNYRHALLLQRAELKQLQMQINPHFLYNSFFLLRGMIEQDMMEESKEVASILGRYFQYITKSNSEMVFLADEYEHALLYLKIQEKRFSHRVNIKVDDLPPRYQSMIVPRLILQPIIENAFNHGIDSKEEGGLIDISCLAGKGYLLIQIEDNGKELSDIRLAEIRDNIVMGGPLDTGDEVTGLMNIYNRLKIFYNREDVMTIGRSVSGGMSVSIKFFDHEKEEDLHNNV